MNCSISVLTPTYNRAALLPRVYASLAAQTFRDFEWIVVDDGSADQTAQIVSDLARSASFPVRYLYQSNRGKHIAVNTGVKCAKGRLVLIFDSDDQCTDDALMFFWERWQELRPRHPDLAGIVASSMLTDGQRIGPDFPKEGVVDRLPWYYDRIRLKGDRWDIHCIEVLREHPFPDIPGERFCPEGLVWNRIGRSRAMAFFSKPLKIVTYLPDGLSRNLVFHRALAPKLSKLYFEELAMLHISARQTFRAACGYVRLALLDDCLGHDFRRHPMLFAVGLPVGLTLHLRDRLALRRGGMPLSLVQMRRKLAGSGHE